MDRIQELVGVVFQALRRMDKEANTLWQGWATGLRQYFYFENPHARGRDDTERAIGRGLAIKLRDSLLVRHVTTEEPYPSSSDRCDLYLDLNDGEKFWIEVKGAWPYIWPGPASIRRNSNFVKHLGSTAADLDKLACLSKPHATHLGLLLVAFDAEHHPEFSIHGNPITADFTGWTQAYNTWPAEHEHEVPGRPDCGYRVQCWFWHRPT